MIADLLRIRRVEFLPAESSIFVIGVVAASPDLPATLATSTLWVGFLLHVLLFHMADMVNCLCDRELDAIHKPHLARAVERLGPRVVAAQVAAHALAVLALAAWLAHTLDRPELLYLICLGIPLGLGYSIRPVHFKGRGVLQLAVLWGMIYIGPLWFATLLTRPDVPATMVALAVSHATLQMAIVLVNTAEDLPEDRDAGIRTVVVALGLRASLTLAATMAVLGALAQSATLLTIAHHRGAGALRASATAPAILVSLAAAAWLVALARRARPLDDDHALAAVRASAARVPPILAAIGMTTLAALLALARGLA